MSAKRTLKQLSPVLESLTPAKKHTSLSAVNHSSGTVASKMTDTFTWAVFDAKLNQALDIKLQNVARKEDISAISLELQSLREENAELKNEVSCLKRKLEQVDKASRRANVVVRGLKSQTPREASVEFAEICQKTLKATASIATTTRVRTGNGFVFALDTARDTDSILAARTKLKNTGIFINRDLTDSEREKSYKLRQIAKQLLNYDNRLKIRTTDFSIFVNNIHVTYQDNKIYTNNNNDAAFINHLFINAKLEYTVAVKKKKNFVEPSRMTASTQYRETAAGVDQ